MIAPIGTEDDWIETDEASCQLLVRPAHSDTPERLTGLPNLAGVILSSTRPDLPLWREWAHSIAIACLTDGAAPGDGALLTGVDHIKAARAKLGADAIIGVEIPNDRHLAMIAGEAGADFLVVGTADGEIDERTLDFVAWWSDVTVLPLAVAGRFDETQAAALVALGAAFLVLNGDQIDPSTKAALQRLFA